MIATVIAFAALTGTLPKVGVIAVALLAAATLLAGSRRARAAAMLAALVLAPVLLLADIWSSSQLRVVHRHPLPSVVAAIVALAVLGAVAAWLTRHPQAFGVLAVLALPFRIPISVGGATSNLLVPLYFVVGAGALAWLVPVLAGRSERPHYRSRREEAAARATAARADSDPAHPPGRTDSDPAHPAPPTGWVDSDPARPSDPPLVVWLARLLSIVVVLYAIQAVYSDAFTTAAQNMVFFYVPFALLYQLLRQVDWNPRLLRGCLTVAVALAIAFSVVGFVEYATKTIILNPKLVVTNDLHTYFTVNSVFFDPDIFGRFLALVMVLLAATLLYRRPSRDQLWAVAALAVIWACLVLTLSRSSLGALLLGLAVLAGLRWRPSRALVAVVVVIAAGGIAVAATPHTFGLEQGVNGVSSGRGGLVSGGVSLFGDRLVWGYGSGSFVDQYRAHHRNVATSLSASHTIPVTIAAEQGIIGLIPYVALVLCALVVLVRRSRGDPVRSALAAAFAALMFHTLLYADFLEDPSTWALLGIGVALAVAPRRGAGPEPGAAEAGDADGSVAPSVA